MFEVPIKVRWTGHARNMIKSYNKNSLTNSSDIFLETISRQKTNIVIRDLREANIVYGELGMYDSMKQDWMNRGMDNALRRIRFEIEIAMNRKGYAYEDGKFIKQE